jgi:hypothetical protein
MYVVVYANRYVTVTYYYTRTYGTCPDNGTIFPEEDLSKNPKIQSVKDFSQRGFEYDDLTLVRTYSTIAMAHQKHATA